MKKKILYFLFISLVCSFWVVSTAPAEKAKPASQTTEATKPKAEATVSKTEAATPKATKMAMPSKEVTMDVQKALNKEGFKVKEDGIMGKQTKAALKKYQKKNGLKATGTPDQATLAKLGIKK